MLGVLSMETWLCCQKCQIVVSGTTICPRCFQKDLVPARDVPSLFQDSIDDIRRPVKRRMSFLDVLKRTFSNQ